MNNNTEILKVKVKLETLENLINNGDDITLPYRQISLMIEEINASFDKYARMLESHQNQINKFNQEAIKARNQIVRMFLVILATLLGKLLISYLTGQ